MEDLVSNDIFFEIGFCFRFLEAAQSQQSLTPKIYNATDQKDKTLYYQLIYFNAPKQLKKHHKTPQKSQMCNFRAQPDKLHKNRCSKEEAML